VSDDPREDIEAEEKASTEAEVEGHALVEQDPEDEDRPEDEAQISDRRAKTAIEPLTGALAALRAL
jgi:hypothetical protein